MARIVKEEEYAGKRNAILDVAQRLIYTKGYEQMTIQDMLDDLQISKGAFYHYFDSKQALLSALIERMGDQIEQLVLAIVRQKLLAARVKYLTPWLSVIIRQGIQEGVFSTSYPEQVGEVLLSLTQDLGDILAGLLLSFEPESDNMLRAERTVAAYTDALERVLGVPTGSLCLVDAEILKEWFFSS